jgi:redox-sensing transcriptional repressor
MIPNPVIRRLPIYLGYIQGLRKAGMEWVSSHDIADALGLTSSTVRQDLSHVELTGISKKGYDTERLETVLREALGVDTLHRVVLVGAGNLGCALASRGELSERGFKICGLFDNNPDLKGTTVGKLKVASMTSLPRVVEKHQVEIGIIAVPSSAAQAVAELLVQAGIKAILNLAYAPVKVPDPITVVDARIVKSLQELAYAVTFKKRQQRSRVKSTTSTRRKKT